VQNRGIYFSVEPLLPHLVEFSWKLCRWRCGAKLPYICLWQLLFHSRGLEGFNLNSRNLQILRYKIDALLEQSFATPTYAAIPKMLSVFDSSMAPNTTASRHSW